MSPKRPRKFCPIWLGKFSELALRAERTEQSGVSEVLTTVMRPTPTKWGEGKFFCMQGHSSLLEKNRKINSSYNKKNAPDYCKKISHNIRDKRSFLPSKIRASFTRCEDFQRWQKIWENRGLSDFPFIPC